MSKELNERILIVLDIRDQISTKAVGCVMNTIVAGQALEQRSMNIDNRLTRHNNNCTSKHTCYNNS